MRTLVVGDIHGALEALLQVFERASINKDDKFIFLGDYVDGWGESALVVNNLIELSKTNECIFLKGNHDEWCKDWLHKGVAPLIWTQQGGQATIDSYINSGELTNDEHRQFFRTLHNYYIDDNNKGFVHGGYTSHKGLGHESYQSDYYWDRDLFTIALSGRHSKNIPKLLRPHKEIFIGHTSTTNWNTIYPINACNLWNLDTGAGWEGVLTIMDVDTKEYWQSDIVKDLYPNERGRS